MNLTFINALLLGIISAFAMSLCFTRIIAANGYVALGTLGAILTPTLTLYCTGKTGEAFCTTASHYLRWYRLNTVIAITMIIFN